VDPVDGSIVICASLFARSVTASTAETADRRITAAQRPVDLFIGMPAARRMDGILIVCSPLPNE
jgi:hypothetical protein